MVHSHQLFSQPKTIAIANRINCVVLYPMEAFIPAFCDFVYKHMWMNRNRNSLDKSRCDSSIKLSLCSNDGNEVHFVLRRIFSKITPVSYVFVCLSVFITLFETTYFRGTSFCSNRMEKASQDQQDINLPGK